MRIKNEIAALIVAVASGSGCSSTTDDAPESEAPGGASGSASGGRGGSPATAGSGGSGGVSQGVCSQQTSTEACEQAGCRPWIGERLTLGEGGAGQCYVGAGEEGAFMDCFARIGFAGGPSLCWCHEERGCFREGGRFAEIGDGWSETFCTQCLDDVAGGQGGALATAGAG